MDNNCDNEQIKGDGTSQAGRYLMALDPANAPIDDRTPEDVLVFAKRYADLVRFYDMDENVDWANTTDNNTNQANTVTENEKPKKNIYTWKEFFYNDIAVVIASIAQYKNKLDAIKQEYDDKRRETNDNPVIQNYRELFLTITHLLQRISRWYSRSIDGHPLKSELELKINSTLKPALKKLISYDKGSDVVKDDGLEIAEQYADFKSAPWGFDYKTMAKDESIYVGTTPAQKIRHASLFADNVFMDVLKVYKELTDRSSFYFTTAIENYSEHQPHIALFITFIELFTFAQKELNGLTQRHLEFYYRDVLHLKERAANPDAVYLIYELAKEAIEFDMKAGTAVTAGKDATGKELIYKIENELVINKAKVKELKTIFLEKELKELHSSPPLESDYKINTIYAAPIAKSADGNGTAFKVTETAWPALGYFKKDITVEQNGIITINNPEDFTGKEAEIGFAIASPQLFLAEGLRKVEIFLQDIDLSPLNGYLEIHLTGENEIVKINVNENDIITGRSVSNDNIIRYFITGSTITITIPEVEKAIVAYDNKIHGEGNKTDFPVVKFIIKDSSKYELLKNISVSPITINVIVTGVKNLILFNSDGQIDTAKPFNPFSLTPRPGSALTIGSKEILSKKLNSLSLFFERKMKNLTLSSLNNVADGTGTSLTVNIELYKDRIWNLFTPKSIDFFDGSIEHISDDKTKPAISSFVRTIDLDTDFNLQKSSYGFLKVSLHFLNGTKDFDDDVNNRIISLELAERFRLYNALSLLLETDRLTINYTSNQTYQPGIEQFFHLYPFGIIETFFPAAEQNLGNTFFDDLDKSKDNLLINTPFLLPQLKFGIDQKKTRLSPPDELLTGLKKDFFNLNQYRFEVYQQGNLCIGMEELLPPQNLSLLFKIADGTAADNDTDPPKINWSYLINNEWRPLPDENIVSDSTYGLQVTGIMLIDFPADATNNNTILTKGLHWLCASVDAAADRIPKIIDVIAQANKAVFFNQQNDPNHYKIPLPAGAIAKLSVKVPEVKIIQQPFESFDGKMREEGKVFYARASERLRHKHRAVTAWDYEHLVLQHFPGIYKVKCLTHTDPECICRHPKTNDGILDTTACCCGQVAPGHVLIVPVSNLRNKAVIDILKPRTGRRTLLQIEEYLKKITSPFVHVHAKNPKFEEIKTSFNVKFYTGTDKGRYLKQLNDDIIQFLTPWAYDESKEVVFGGSVYAFNIINFIEKLDYVDYITCFRMIHIAKGCCDKDTLKELTCTDMRKKLEDIIDIVNNTKLSERCLSLIEATSPQAILTSAKKHCIELIPEPTKTKDCNCS